jgi:hypothetical protein
MTAERRAGSGLVNETAAIIERMIAAAFRGDISTVRDEERFLRSHRLDGNCGMAPHVIGRLVVRMVETLGFDVADAQARPPSLLGDVELTLQDSSLVWLEVKAQTKKARFSEITQADWVRDETDTLRWLAAHNADFARRLPSWLEAILRPLPGGWPEAWGLEDLWLSDIALLVSGTARSRAGVSTRQQLDRFLERKLVVHLTQEGLRACRLADLAPVAAVNDGSGVEVLLKDNAATAVAAALKAPGPVGHGATHFTYHVGYSPNVIGRHKMHALAFAGVPFLVDLS